MKLLPALAGLGLAAGAAWWLWRGSSSSPASVTAAAPPEPAPISVLPGAKPSASVRAGVAPGSITAATAPLATLGPGGVVAAIGGAITDLLVSTGVADAAVAEVAGASSRTRGNRRDLIDAQSSLTNEVGPMESWIERAFSALSRPDVVWWRQEQNGELAIQFAGRAGSSGLWRLPIPRTAQNPAAWGAELTTRLYGAPVQEGRGPVKGPLPLYSDRVGFSESNPYAPRNLQAPKVTSALLKLQGAVARSQTRPAPTTFEA